jgi:ectoine hydroxylase-related dioxygenase (phytanoyl-CoA dioxygenase family)
VIAQPSAIAADVHHFFRREGYLHLPGLVHADRCAEILDEFAAAVPEARRAAGARAYWRTSAAHVRLLSAGRLLRSNELLAALRSILGPDVALVTNRHDHITVNAGMGKAGRLHRDVLHWSRNLVSLIVYVNVPPAHELGNGTAVLPGSHLLPALGEPNNGGTWLDDGPHAALAAQAVSVPAAAGSALLMDGMTYHCAQTRLPEDASCLTQARVAISWACRAVDELHDSDLAGPIELLVGQQRYRGNDQHGLDDGADRRHAR